MPGITSSPHEATELVADASTRGLCTDAAPRDQIERLIARHSLLGQWKLEFVCSHWASSSDVLEYRRRDRAGARPLMVKHRNRRMDRTAGAKEIEDEFHILEDLWNRTTPQSRETIPRPVALLPEAGAAVFEAVQGIPMTQRLRREANRLTGPFFGWRLSRIAGQCGKWLHSFHAVTASGPDEHDLASYLNKLDYWLEKSRARGLDPEIAGRLWQMANRANGPAGKRGLPAAGIHGDFIPQNIFISAGHISVIDFASYKHPETPYEDLGLFVAYLRLLASAPAYSKYAINAMVRAFLHGYGECADARVLSLYVIKAMLMIFADQFAAADACLVESEKITRIKAELARASFDPPEFGILGRSL